MILSRRTQPSNCPIFGAQVTSIYLNLNSSNGLGFFAPAANVLAVTTNGTERMRFDASGNIGIGTTSPGAPFHVHYGATAYSTPASLATGPLITNLAAYGQLNLVGDTGHGAGLIMGDVSNAQYGSITQFGTTASEGGRMRFIAGNTETMNLRGGYVGIGTQNPTRLLEIENANGQATALLNSYDGNAGDASALFFRVDPSDVGTYARGKGAIFFQRTGSYGVGLLQLANNGNADNTSASTGGDVAITITGSQKVGIGTVNPASKLHVSSGTLTIDGSGAPPNGYALCLSGGQMGHCTSAVGSSGTCTCSVP